MRSRTVAPMVALALLAAGCGGPGDVPADPSPAPSPTAPAPSPAPTPSATPTAVPTGTPAPSPSSTGAACDAADVLATVEAAVVAARLASGIAWSEADADGRFAARTTTGDEYARRLGLDCGLAASAVVGTDGERLLVAAWTGARSAWVVQSSERPTAPYRADATVDLLVGWTTGEWLDDDRTQWAGTLASGETFVVGHTDFSLGAAAKDWVATDEPPPADRDLQGLLASEQHGVLVLEAAGMREVDVAQPPEVGSQEGYLSFVAPTGQVSVADIAPTGWFDPMQARYFTGPTRIATIDGITVRITEPGPDAPDWAVGVEVGFACDAFEWLLEPPLNGTADEAIASATAILATPACRGLPAG